MLALCLMLLVTYYAFNYASIIDLAYVYVAVILQLYFWLLDCLDAN